MTHFRWTVLMCALILTLNSRLWASPSHGSCQHLFASLPLSSPLNPAKNEIHFRIHGEGNPETLVLIHGLDSATQTFDPIIGELSKKFRVLVYDQRGHGLSVARGDDYSTPVMASDLKALLDHLNIKQAHILGHSMGGRTAARFAELFPDRVKSVMIEDMELIQRTELTPEKKQSYLKQVQALRTQFANKTFPSRQSLIDALIPYYGREAESISLRRARENPDGTITLLFNPDVSFLHGFQANTEDLSRSLTSARKPVLVLQADPRQGSAISPEGAKHAISDIPGAQLIKIPGSGHAIHRTHSDSFNELVTEFMTQGSIGAALIQKNAPQLRAKGSIPIEFIFKIEDPKVRVSEISRIEVPELSESQLVRLIEMAPGLTNSFEMGQYIRLAGESADSRWLPVLENWIKQWDNSTVAWQGFMKKSALNARQAIRETLEKSMNTSTEGTALDPQVQALGLMPRGSAVITTSGELEKQGIRSIIHAASGSMSHSGPAFEPTLDGVTNSVKNSLSLARQHGHKRVAVPFIGGKIFVDRIGIPAEELADQIVTTALRNRGDLELRFVTFGEEDTRLFEKALAKHGTQTSAKVLSGSITDFSLHGSSAIINAANMEVRFGGGLSGAIARATGKAQEIDAQAQEAIRNFYAALSKAKQ